MGEKALKIRVRGQVQGVGYRRYAQRTAGECRIHGWARNLRTGEVEILALGNETALEKYLKLLRQGPPFGRVEELTTQPAELEKINDFSILPDGASE